MVRSLLTAWRSAPIDFAGVARAAKAGDIDHAVRLIQDVLPKRTMAAFEPRASRAFLRGAALGRAHIGAKTAKDSTDDLLSELNLDGVNAAALDWASAHAADLVDADESTREIIRLMTTGSVGGEATVDELASAIQSVIGLTAAQARAVANFGDGLAADGVDPDVIDRRVGRYASALQKYRATTIARTELIAATNAGQQALWDAAVDGGALDAGAMVKEWIATEDDLVDPVCESLDGTTTTIDGRFDGGYDHPPAHPRCRCSVGLRYA